MSIWNAKENCWVPIADARADFYEKLQGEPKKAVNEGKAR